MLNSPSGLAAPSHSSLICLIFPEEGFFPAPPHLVIPTEMRPHPPHVDSSVYLVATDKSLLRS